MIILRLINNIKDDRNCIKVENYSNKRYDFSPPIL